MSKRESLQEPKNILKKYKKLLIQLDNENINRHTKVKKIHKFIDDQNKQMFENQTICQQGCSHCCHINIDLPESEASYIADNINKPIKKDIIFSMHSKQYDGQSCIFLDAANQCSIYEYRPSVCRMYSVFESIEKCASGEAQKQITINSSTLIRHLFSEYLMNKLSKNVTSEYSNEGLRDIREWF